MNNVIDSIKSDNLKEFINLSIGSKNNIILLNMLFEIAVSNRSINIVLYMINAHMIINWEKFLIKESFIEVLEHILNEKIIKDILEYGDSKKIFHFISSKIHQQELINIIISNQCYNVFMVKELLKSMNHYDRNFLEHCIKMDDIELIDIILEKEFMNIQEIHKMAINNGSEEVLEKVNNLYECMSMTKKELVLTVSAIILMIGLIYMY